MLHKSLKNLSFQHKIEKIGDRQQVGAAAGREVSLDHGPVQRPHGLRIGAGSALQQGPGLPDGPPLPPHAAPGKQVGVRRAGGQGQKGGRPRLLQDGLLMAFNGIEFLREHVPEDTRMHYTILQSPGPANVVPDTAAGKFMLRSYSRKSLDAVVERFKEIIQGAALIAGVTYDMKEGDRLTNKIPVLSLNRLIMENAELVHAPRISPPREKTGSSDFSNVMYQLPGSCIQVAMVPKGTSSHSLEFLNAGKGEEAHEAVLIAAKVLSGTACDLTENPALLEEIQAEFRENQEKHS